MTNLVSNLGVVSTDVNVVGTSRSALAAAGYGGDKAIFGYGIAVSTARSLTNLVSNIGVVSTDTTGVGSARFSLAATGYGGDKAIFGYGLAGSNYSATNLVSNIGVVSTDTTGVGTARYYLAAASYGVDKAIFGYGLTSSVNQVAIINLVSNVGVVATDTSTSTTTMSRGALAAASYGGDKAIFGFGSFYNNMTLTQYYVNTTNLVSNLGVVAADVYYIGTGREGVSACSFGS
jgi:hypothetical protein